MNNGILKKKKVAFILDHDLKAYRLPLFLKLQDSGVDVTVFHSGDEVDVSKGFKQKLIKRVLLGPFEYRSLPPLSGFDIVVHMQNIRMLNLWFMTFNPFRRFKLIHWGIGMSSRKGVYEQSKFIIKLRNLLAFFSSSQVLYSEYPLRYFSKIVLSKTFVAHNTVYSPFSVDLSNRAKKHFLFIGALNKRKGLVDLIDAFEVYLSFAVKSEVRKLVIIGDGEERSNLNKMIVERNLQDYVELVGQVQDEKLKASYFEGALACISPKQAGLSVLESFSYGVPFLAYHNAISGGEHLNIISGSNGFLAKDKPDLTKLMIKLSSDLEEASEMGARAFAYYHEFRSLNNMVDSFRESFNYVSSN